MNSAPQRKIRTEDLVGTAYLDFDISVTNNFAKISFRFTKTRPYDRVEICGQKRVVHS